MAGKMPFLELKAPFKMSELHAFSVLERDKQMLRLQSTKYDLIIIGGGVTGAGIALDAASRGLKTCLVEKCDFASGTSNKSTKLIHGGLRYLKQFEIGLVKESGRERATVHKLAPHLVIPEKMLLPLTKDGVYGSFLTSVGLKIYDILANVEGDDRRKMLTKKETIEKEPLLNKSTLLGGGYYSEYRTDDARLTIELLKTAHRYGADIINYCKMEQFIYSDKQMAKGIICIDQNTKTKFSIKSRRVVSAAGPWVDRLRKKDRPLNSKHLYLTKGVHLVFSKNKIPVKQSIYFDAPDGRMIFAIPRGKVTYVGTTDTPYTGSLNRVVCTKHDVDYILQAINETFNSFHVTINDVQSSWAGLRPLIHEDAASPSELSRKDEIFVSETGLISIAGGKLTGYRKMAQRVNAKVLSTLKKKHKLNVTSSITRNISLTPDSFKSLEEVDLYKKELRDKLLKAGLDCDYQVTYLTSTYGRQTSVILDNLSDFKNEPIVEKLILAELWYCINYEMMNSLSDFFVRRTGRLFFDIESIYKYKKVALAYCKNALNWDTKRATQEIAQLELLVKDATTFYEEDIASSFID